MLASSCGAAPPSSRFVVTFSRKVTSRPFTGRVYVMLSMAADSEPRLGDDWLNPPPMFALDVRNWKPGAPITIDDRALSYPARPSRLPAGDYSAQAVMDLRLDTHEIATAPGNGFSAPLLLRILPGRGFAARLKIDRVVPKRRFVQDKRIRLVDIPSALLSGFYHRPIRMQAAVILPEGYDADAARRYPTVYVIPGFGGDHFMAPDIASGAYPLGPGDIPAIEIVPNPDAPTGHSVFADSANNGPRGAAFVQELVPYIERTYRCVPQAGARFLTGHSSGGWAALWLQIAYPDFFGGVWSIAPDPVNFRAFQTVDIYAPGANFFRDAKGHARPFARLGDQPADTMQQFSDMEQVLGKGGQFGSCEAVFSPRGAGGKPRHLWDRRTGKIDPAVALAWRRYDIRAILDEHWAALRDKLRGKVHVFTGGEDTFYLDGAVRLLKASLEKRGSDAVVEIVPNRDHGSILSMGLRERIGSEMMHAFEAKTAALPARGGLTIVMEQGER